MQDESQQRVGGITVSLDGYDGPLDLLLDLAHREQIDLLRLSIVTLADQFVAFVRQATRDQMTDAADFLVMVCWLLYLKSRCLLPDPPEDEPDPEALAQALKERLIHLDAIRHCARELLTRAQLGQERWARGTGWLDSAAQADEALKHDQHPQTDTRALERQDETSPNLPDLLSAYASLRLRDEQNIVTLAASQLIHAEQALEHLETVLFGSQRFMRSEQAASQWYDLVSFLPALLQDAQEVAKDAMGQTSELRWRAAMAAFLVAALELARRRRVELDQQQPFGPVRLRTGRDHQQDRESITGTDGS